ncbi:hypothetical protein AAFC00_005643 [Neodothiora populina]|uniref:Dihydrolipoamide acetyltransferase component of pyruvate dehydrogenase complex n=1 Tax=Neodothiora populina TaxID=2781224 RepID=A0ABR3PML6_9PEZI
MSASGRRHAAARLFHSTRRKDVVKPFLLADIGEGIRECQIIQWFVQPGARVEQFDKICEVQSDKAAVEITSPFDGVIKELHYEADDMAIVGKPLLLIDIQSEIRPDDEAKVVGIGDHAGEKPSVSPAYESGGGTETQTSTSMEISEQVAEGGTEGEEIHGPLGRSAPGQEKQGDGTPAAGSSKQMLATPAVRSLLREHRLDLNDIQGSDKEGRVLKEDVHRHLAAATTADSDITGLTSPPLSVPSSREIPLTPNQSAMFKTMTASLSIPHFLYTTPVNLTPLTKLRKKLNKRRVSSSSASLTKKSQDSNEGEEDDDSKLTPLPFILKAVSKAFTHHPLLNSSLQIPASDTNTKPTLVQHSAHNFGIAIDTPTGLVVPVINNLSALSVLEIAIAIKTLTKKARAGRLTASELQGATFTISNVGAVGGGGVVSPVVVAPQVGILGVGRGRIVPAFVVPGEEDDYDEGIGEWVSNGVVGVEGNRRENKKLRLVAREECIFSWSADHRVVDGAECARCAERVKDYLERVDEWAVDLR